MYITELFSKKATIATKHFVFKTLINSNFLNPNSFITKNLYISKLKKTKRKTFSVI